MNFDEQNIEALVQAVLREMKEETTVSTPSKSKSIPKTAKVAMLTKLNKFEVKEFPIPKIGDNDILVKVEGCGVCGTDVHEWRSDPFGLIPVVLGHEGTGEIVAMGKNITEDTQGNPINVGDKLVTSVAICGECPMCKLHPELPQLCQNAKIQGLIPDDDKNHLHGWFSNYMLIEDGATFFNVSDMTLDQRMLIELAAVATHAVRRADDTRLMPMGATIVIQGCGPVGLMVIAHLKTKGYRNIIAIDGTPQRLEMAKRFGASHTINFKEYKTVDDKVNYVKKLTHSLGADFAFQCTGSPAAAAEVWKYVRTGGGLCEMGFFVNNGECSINPHFDICNKEVTVVGSWTYGALEYPDTISFVKQCCEMGIPLTDIITHRYGLDEMNEAMETNVAQKGLKIAYVNKEI
ncbi:MAG: zinc-binding dehydrogenase [Oscillospiraceae bacterium]